VTLLLPLALLGLLTLPVILLLHLLRNRREQLLIPSLRLWQGLQQSRQGGRPRTIPLSFLLLLQLLAATALTLALARPALSFMLGRAQHTIFILDRTTSMTATAAGDSSLYDQARNEVVDHIAAMRPDDSVTVIGLSDRPRVLLQGTGAQQSTLLLGLDNVVPGFEGQDLSRAFSLAGSLVDPERGNRLVILTDGRYNVDPNSLPPMALEPEWQILGPSSSRDENQAVLNFSTYRLPDGRHRLFARVVNYGERPVERGLVVFADETVAAETTVTIEPQAEVSRVWTVPAATEAATVELLATDALPADDRAELFLGGVVNTRVLIISETPDTLVRVFAAQPAVEVTVVDTLPDETAEYDLLVLDGLPAALTRWPAGNVLVVDPPLGHPLLPTDRSARALRPNPDSASRLFNGVDLSAVVIDRAVRLVTPNWATVDLAAVDSQSDGAETPLVLRGSPVPGSRVMVWAFDPDASNLPGRVAFPLLTANSLAALLDPSPPASIAPGTRFSCLVVSAWRYRMGTACS
jgi:Ca-activated chloride channel family protein